MTNPTYASLLSDSKRADHLIPQITSQLNGLEVSVRSGTVPQDEIEADAAYIQDLISELGALGCDVRSAVQFQSFLDSFGLD